MWILLGIIAVIVILLHFSLSAHIRLGREGINITAKYLWFTVYPRKPKEHKSKRTKAEKAYVPPELDEDEFEDDLDEELGDAETEVVTERITKQTASQEEERLDKKPNAESEEPKPQTADKKDKGKEKKPKKDKPKKRKGKSEAFDKKKKESPIKRIKRLYTKVKPYIPMGMKACRKMLKTIRIENLRAEVNVGRIDAHEAVIFYGALQGAMFNIIALLAQVFTVKIKDARVNCEFTRNTVSGELEADIRIRPSAVIALGVCTAVNFLRIFFKERRKNKKEEKLRQSAELKTESELQNV